MSPGMTPAADAFTIEGWFYNTSGFTTKGLLGTDQSVGMSAHMSDNATVVLDRYGGGYAPFYGFGANAFKTNQWQYIVINRNASLLETMWLGTFVDNFSTVTCARATSCGGGTGVSGGTQTDSQSWGNSNWVGRFYGGYFPGYITNLKVTIGEAVYDSNSATITAPVAPLTSGANTKYLMLGAVVTTDTSGTQTVTNNGTVTQTATKPF
tara:strand:+ start:1434 stop:2060 length:627 start_codon:yes stop_codon:yes gene_type:complete